MYPKSSELTNKSVLSFFSTPLFIEIVVYVRPLCGCYLYTDFTSSDTHIYISGVK